MATSPPRNLERYPRRLPFGRAGGTRERTQKFNRVDHREHDQRNSAGDPDALAARIIDALEKADYQVSPDNLGSQPFDELKPSMRPQDIHGDGKDWIFETSEHGGDEPDTMPQAIKATDGLGRWAIYVPLSRNGKIVIPRPEYDDSE
jgi:hypothetical protein